MARYKLLIKPSAVKELESIPEKDHPGASTGSRDSQTTPAPTAVKSFRGRKNIV
ncbi:MAG: hypothetical protein RRA15_13340 [bacterium]|nr:hypothetical protein [bacterium]